MKTQRIVVFLRCVFHGIRLLRLIKKLVVVRQSILFLSLFYPRFHSLLCRYVILGWSASYVLPSIKLRLGVHPVTFPRPSCYVSVAILLRFRGIPGVMTDDRWQLQNNAHWLVQTWTPCKEIWLYIILILYYIYYIYYIYNVNNIYYLINKY